MSETDWQHEFVETNGVRLHVVTAGEGPLVLLLHGFPQFWYAWRHQISALAERFRVVAPDLRGYGESDKPRGLANYRLDVLSADVAGLVHALGAERAHVVGHDWGGGVAWATALDHPEVVDRLCVLNCPHPKPFAKALRSSPRQLARSWYILFFQLPWIPEAMLRWRNAAIVKRMFRDTVIRKGTFSDADLDEFQRAILVPGAATGMLNYYRSALRDWRRQGELVNEDQRIHSPTLVIWAEEDFALGVELTHDMEGLFAAPFRIEYIPNCSHWVNEEQPDEVNRHLLEFLSESH